MNHNIEDMDLLRRRMLFGFLIAIGMWQGFEIVEKISNFYSIEIARSTIRTAIFVSGIIGLIISSYLLVRLSALKKDVLKTEGLEKPFVRILIRAGKVRSYLFFSMLFFLVFLMAAEEIRLYFLSDLIGNSVPGSVDVSVVNQPVAAAIFITGFILIFGLIVISRMSNRSDTYKTIIKRAGFELSWKWTAVYIYIILAFSVMSFGYLYDFQYISLFFIAVIFSMYLFPVYILLLWSKFRKTELKSNDAEQYKREFEAYSAVEPVQNTFISFTTVALLSVYFLHFPVLSSFLGMAVFLYYSFRYWMYYRKTQEDPALKSALNNEMFQTNMLRSFRIGFFFVLFSLIILGFAAHFYGLPGLIVAQTAVFAGIISCIVSFLFIERRMGYE